MGLAVVCRSHLVGMRERPRIIGTGSVRRLLLDLKSPGLCAGNGCDRFLRGESRPGCGRSLVEAAEAVGAMSEKRLPYLHLEELDRRHSNIKEGRTGLIMGHSRPGHSSSKRMRRLVERCIRNDILSSR